MNIYFLKIAVLALLTVSSAYAQDKTVLMSAEWGTLACEAWNQEPILTNELAESGWVDNIGERGDKVMQIFRNDCGDTPTAELRIQRSEGQALCTYGGGIETTGLVKKHDYVMNATTEYWLDMGAGDLGPMKAMMFGRLKFQGPKMEAMGNMGPFENFLLLVGVVESDSESCPQ